MATLQQQWEDMQTILQRRSDAFINAAFPSIPTEFYQVYPGGVLQICTTIGSHYTYPFKTYLNGKKATRKEVDELGIKLEEPYQMDLDKVWIDYSSQYGDGYTSKSAYSAKKLFAGEDRLFIDKEAAIAKSAELTDKHNADKAFDEKHKKDANYDYKANGYKFLGWQNNWGHVYFDAEGNVTTDPTKRKTFGYLTKDYPEYGVCRDAEHRTIHVQHNNRGSENTVSCPVCKIMWKYDSSD